MTEFILPTTLHLFEPLNIILMLAGLTGGIIIGALPGLSATMGVALMVPATFAMNPTSGLIMLGAIYAGAIYGGANSAILICTPGTPSSVATTFDGWPLCQKGRADLGLYTSLLSSAFGGIVGTLFLLCLGGSLARFALQFGGPESFWLCLFGLSTIAVMTPDNMGKGIVSGAVGILVSTIGLDPNTGAPRFTFGTYDLLQGVSVIPCMIGLFSFSQVLYLIGTDKSFIAEYHPHKREPSARCSGILPPIARRSSSGPPCSGRGSGCFPAREARSLRSSPTTSPSGGTRTLPAMARGALRGSPPPKARTMRSSAARSSPC